MNKENCFIVLLLLIVLGGIGGLILGWSVSEFGLWGLFVGVMMFTLSEGVVAYGFATDGSWYPGFVLHMVGAGVTLAVLLHMTDAFQEHLVFGQPFFYNISLDNGDWLDGRDSGLAWYFLFAVPIVRTIIVEPMVLWKFWKAKKKGTSAA